MTLTGEKLLKIIENLKHKTSCGFDGISMKLVKFIKKNVLVDPLTIILNQLLHTGVFPDLLKITRVTHIYKKDDKTNFSNYRPISLLPAVSNIFEVIFSQTYEFFHKEKLFYGSQYGFRNKHSTEFAALEIVDRLILKWIIVKHQLLYILTLIQNILLHKLEYYGVQDISLNLFKNYLSNSKQYVEYDGVSSEMQNITTGVPQGSILGPHLFIIYISMICLKSAKSFDSLCSLMTPLYPLAVRLTRSCL